MRRPFALFFWIAAAVAPAYSQTYLVAPFANHTTVTSFDWLGESLSETIRETLAEEGYSTVTRDDREEAARKLSIKPVSHVSLASLAPPLSRQPPRTGSRYMKSRSSMARR